MNKIKTERFFIYGTLKEGYCNNYILLRLTEDAPIPCQTIEKYPMYKGNEYFPYVENKPGLGRIIKGELYEIPVDKIEFLDNFESVPDLYMKGKVKVEAENFIYEDVNIYFRAHPIDNRGWKNKLIDEWLE